jgi:hypothetical protein
LKKKGGTQGPLLPRPPRPQPRPPRPSSFPRQPSFPIQPPKNISPNLHQRVHYFNKFQQPQPQPRNRADFRLSLGRSGSTKTEKTNTKFKGPVTININGIQPGNPQTLNGLLKNLPGK